MTHDPLCSEDSRDLGFTVHHKDGTRSEGEFYCDCEVIERVRKDEREKMWQFIGKVAAASYAAGAKLDQ